MLDATPLTASRLLRMDQKVFESSGVALSSRELEVQLQHLKDTGIQVVTRADHDFPTTLRDIYDPPAALYFRGTIRCDGPRVAMVGSRRATPAGRAIAQEMAHELAAAGITVVSGLARGIDGAAHEGALTAGVTWAILGSGLDRIYPFEHLALSEQVASDGALLSEYPPNTPPLPLHFPARNRLISGLSDAVVIVEAAARSGALITADFALEHGRDVLAVPGPVRSRASVGCHRLLQQGAGLVTSAQDIIAALGYDFSEQLKSRNTKEGSSLEAIDAAGRELLETIPFEPTSLDSIVGDRVATSVLPRLSELELAGLIIRNAGGLISRLR